VKYWNLNDKDTVQFHSEKVHFATGAAHTKQLWRRWVRVAEVYAIEKESSLFGGNREARNIQKASSLSFFACAVLDGGSYWLVIDEVMALLRQYDGNKPSSQSQR
jgi:hypothetical protein